MLNREEVKQKIKEYIHKNNHVSYAELQWYMEQIGYDYRGDYTILSPKCDHVIFWVGWSEDAIQIMNELNAEGSIHKEPTQVLTYFIDGATLTMPIVKTARAYKTDHWLPVVFCRGPEEALK